MAHNAHDWQLHVKAYLRSLENSEGLYGDYVRAALMFADEKPQHFVEHLCSLVFAAIENGEQFYATAIAAVLWLYPQDREG